MALSSPRSRRTSLRTTAPHRTRRDTYLGEWPWRKVAGLGSDGLRTVEGRHYQKGEAPTEVTPTWADYHWEGDGSLVGGVNKVIPASWLVRCAGLRWHAGDFAFSNSSGEVVVFDPSAKEQGPSACSSARTSCEPSLTERTIRLSGRLSARRTRTGSSTGCTLPSLESVASVDWSRVTEPLKPRLGLGYRLLEPSPPLPWPTNEHLLHPAEVPSGALVGLFTFRVRARRGSGRTPLHTSASSCPLSSVVREVGRREAVVPCALRKRGARRTLRSPFRTSPSSCPCSCSGETFSTKAIHIVRDHALN